MSSSSTCGSKCYGLLVCLGRILQPFLLLAIRLFWGYLFIQTGLEKLSNPGSTAEYFQSLNIPASHITVYLVAGLEVLCGALIIIGLASRLAAIPLIAITVTAYLTAHVAVFKEVLAHPEAITKEPPFNFLLAALIVFCFGPGLFSIDAIVKKLRCRKSCETKVDTKDEKK